MNTPPKTCHELSWKVTKEQKKGLFQAGFLIGEWAHSTLTYKTKMTPKNSYESIKQLESDVKRK